jgi:hypothetical protein
MVTPTFAAGLGVVVAAGLAVSMTTRTVLHFSGPVQQKVCTGRSCASGHDLPGGVGTLASAKPGVPLAPTTGGQSGSAQSGSSSTMGQPGGHVVIDYQTTKKWSWGFDGQIMISGLPATSRGTWRLAFDYPGTSIVEVQGAQWQPTGQNSGVAEAPSSRSGPGGGQNGGGQNGPDANGGNPGSGQGQAGHGSRPNAVVITIEASGPASGPGNCHFDNAPCTFR